MGARARRAVDSAQQRSIAIADLQVKVAEVERQRGEMANRLREEVLLSVLDFERTRREFQGFQEIGRRSQLRNEILRLNYRFVADSMSTPQYLAEQNALDVGDWRCSGIGRSSERSSPKSKLWCWVQRVFSAV
ncbi:hypothetical protein ACQ4M4_04175 [Leptolyngbya sp. AN02str]|uniref:hypothetical protein n=1 Tax=Leptolyngbya sp. AN02str TaxID=3423363 RepID=UPI003D312B50